MNKIIFAVVSFSFLSQVQAYSKNGFACEGQGKDAVFMDIAAGEGAEFSGSLAPVGLISMGPGTTYDGKFNSSKMVDGECRVAATFWGKSLELNYKDGQLTIKSFYPGLAGAKCIARGSMLSSFKKCSFNASEYSEAAVCSSADVDGTQIITKILSDGNFKGFKREIIQKFKGESSSLGTKQAKIETIEHSLGVCKIVVEELNSDRNNSLNMYFHLSKEANSPGRVIESKILMNSDKVAVLPDQFRNVSCSVSSTFRSKLKNCDFDSEDIDESPAAEVKAPIRGRR